MADGTTQSPGVPQSPAPADSALPPALRREVGVLGATMMGLGSIIGTGVFVSISIAAGVAGPAVILATAVAAGVAVCNGLSSAQLAARHPVSGGTYEYGYRWLHPLLGFTAGWMFLCAKSASAATAALGASGYLLTGLGAGGSMWRVPIALLLVAILTGLVMKGIRRSSNSNLIVVAVTLLTLALFVIAGSATALGRGGEHLTPFFQPVSPSVPALRGFLEACALMFVAFTGYGRIATLAEEVREPRRTIPTAVIVTLTVSMVIYVSVAYVGIATIGAAEFAAAGTRDIAPLQVVARAFEIPGVALLVVIGGISAMVGVLLNLILGLSRVALAMGRRRDLPAAFAGLDRGGNTPAAAVLLVGGTIAVLVAIGDVKTTWSFSAFTVLIYYAITNLAAIRMSDQERLYPRFVPWLGLGSCLFLACWIDPQMWLVGLGLIAGGGVWFAVCGAFGERGA